MNCGAVKLGHCLHSNLWLWDVSVTVEASDSKGVRWSDSIHPHSRRPTVLSPNTIASLNFRTSFSDYEDDIENGSREGNMYNKIRHLKDDRRY